MAPLGTNITRVISGGDGARRANGKESSGEMTKALASPDVPVALPMTPLCRVQSISPIHPGPSSLPDMEPHGGTRKARLPQDGHRAELRLDPEETSLSSISIGALRSQLLGRTQRPIQEGCSSKSQQMSRGAQEGVEKRHSAWHQPCWGPPRASGRGGLRSAATGGTLCFPSDSFL